MIVLDTNVISELMRSEPHPTVRGWIAAQPRETLVATSASIAEILYGIRALPKGRRRTSLEDAARKIFEIDLSGRTLSFDAAAAHHYSELVVAREAAGTPISTFDALIAATAYVAGASVATRDVSGFEGCGLTVINPWSAD